MRKPFAVTLALLLALAGVLALLLLLAGPATPVRADPGTLYVAPGGDCGGMTPCYAAIQDAVDSAFNGDTIQVSQGVYTSTAFQVVYINKAITLTGGYTTTDWANSYPITRPSVIDAESVSGRRGMYINSSSVATITLAGLTIQRGYIQDANGGGIFIVTGTVVLRESQLLNNQAIGNYPNARGGGMYMSGGTITLIDNSFQSNSANTDGGGVYATNSTLTLSGNTFQSNSVTSGSGAGVYVTNGSAEFTDNLFQDNSVGGWGDFYGGGVYMSGSNVILNGNSFQSNSASYGGGAYVYNSIGTLSGNTFQDNSAMIRSSDAGGGGVYVGYSTVTLSSNVFQGNSTISRGGGVHISGGNVTLSSNFVLSNTAAEPGGYQPRGGGVYIAGGDVTLEGNAILSNTTSTSGGGIYVYWGGGNIILDNNSICNNKALSSGGGVYVSISSGIVNLSGNTILGNMANQYGGGVYANDGTITLSNTEVLSNTADTAGGGIAIAGGTVIGTNNIVANNISPWEGVYLSGGSLSARHWTLANNGNYALRTNGGSVVLTNTIVASHTIGGFSGFNIAADHTLFFASGTPCSGGAVCTSTLTGDPYFANPAAGDYHIGPGSAAIDAGVDAGVTDDIDGDTRPLRAGYDVGADEFPYPPIAGFTHSAPDWVGQDTIFTNTTVVTSAVVSYLWAFGDGVFSTAVSPAHAYAAPGDYTAVLTATNPAGTSVASASVTLYAASFASSSPHPPGQTTVFTNTTATSGTTAYLWSFGDGVTSTLASPTHTYSVGTYLAVLTATNFAGSGVATGTVIVDGTPPTGTVAINAGALYATAQPASLTLTAGDDRSGVAAMSFSDDGATFTPFEPYAPFRAWILPAGDGLKAVYARFRDAAGNVSGVCSDTIVLDTAVPGGSIVIDGGAEYAARVTATLTLSASDATSGLAGMQFSDDGAAWGATEPYTATRAWTLTSGDGAKTMYVRYSDNAGNMSVFSDTIILDTTPPASAVNPLPTYQAALTFTVSWDGLDTGAGLDNFDVQVRDGTGGTWIDWLTSTTQISATFSGTDGHTYYFRCRGTDTVSNTESYSGGDGDAQTTVDVTAPTGTVQIDGGLTYALMPTVTLSLAAWDVTSGVSDTQYSNDGIDFSAWEAYTASKGWMLIPGDGIKTVYVRFRDVAGNVSTTYSDTIILDTTAPTDTIQIDDGATYTAIPTVTLALEAHDANGVTNMRFSSDAVAFSAWLPYSTTHTWRLADGDGTRAAYVQYRDTAGNVSPSYFDTIILDTTPPTAAVDALTPYQTELAFAVSWSGTDALAGTDSFDVQVRDGDTAWTDWLTETTAFSATFEGLDGHIFYFRARARDVLGNLGSYALGGDTATRVDTTRPEGELAINGGAIDATSRDVVLVLTANGASQMAFSNNGVTFGSWEPFAATRPYSLTTGDSLKTVYVRYRDPAGNTAEYSDTITLNTGVSGDIGLSINDDDAVTEQITVTLTLKAPPGTRSVMVSNSSRFVAAEWEPYSISHTWVLAYHPHVTVYQVYAKFRGVDDTISERYDDIITLYLPEPPPPVDNTPPSGSVVINAGADETWAQNVTLDVLAADNPGGVGVQWMYFREWKYDPVTVQWIIVRSSGWLPYSEAGTAWTLAPGTGVKYIGAWFADGANNVSNPVVLDSINLVLPGDTIGQTQVTQYRQTFEPGQIVTVTLTVAAGDADLYIWRPGSIATPDYWSNLPGMAVERLVFTAVEGEYLIEVHGYASSVFTLDIATGGIGGDGSAQRTTAARSTASPVVAASKPLPVHPLVTTQPGGTPPSEEPRHYIYLPLVLRNHP